MIITRKLLTPILIAFTVLVIVLLAVGYNSSQKGFEQDESASLNNQVNIFYNRLDSLKNFALALATETASNPEIQKAFANGDRERLTELTLPGYLAVDKQFDVPQAQFHVPPATSFLRLHQLDRFGDDLSLFRFTVLTANRDKQPVAGLEIGRGGLGMRGVAPVHYNNNHIGTIEYGLNVDRTLLLQLSQQFGNDWQILLLREPAEIAVFQGAVEGIQGPTQDFLLQASTLEEPIFAEADDYLQAKNGANITSRLRLSDNIYAIISAPIFDYSGDVIGILNIIENRTAAVRANNLTFLGIGLGAFAILAVLMGGTAVFVSRTLQPIASLTNTASQIAGGDIELQAPVESIDEIGQLGQAFNSMTSQLRLLIGSLEVRVTERTSELEKANQQIQRRAEQFESIAQVSRAISSVQNQEDLLTRITRMISHYFGFYHVGVFLLDNNKQYAVLRAANSEGGQKMLKRGHRLGVGQTGIVGDVASTGNPRIALDTGVDAVYFNNPDLPNTRSEIALPLKSSGQVIGALDVQSTESNAFTQEDINILLTLADQVSSALENSRLHEDAREALAKAETAYRQLTGDTWTNIRRFAPVFGYRFDGSKAQPLNQPTNGNQAEGQKEALSIPVQLRGQAIGMLRIKPGSNGHQWTEDEIVIIQATAERVALAAENARLVAESQKRASKEQVIGEVSSRISSAINLDNILQTALREMGRILPGAEISIQVENE